MLRRVQDESCAVTTPKCRKCDIRLYRHVWIALLLSRRIGSVLVLPPEPPLSESFDISWPVRRARARWGVMTLRARERDVHSLWTLEESSELLLCDLKGADAAVHDALGPIPTRHRGR
jgi:hypothetical protein